MHLFQHSHRINDMDHRLKQSFKDMKEIEPPLGMKEAVFKMARLEGKRSVRRKLVLSYLGLAASFSALLWSGWTFGSGFVRSDFWNLLSLAASDIAVVSSFWQDFSFSLMETFPAINLMAILIPIFTMFLSLGAFLDLTNNKHKYI